MIQDCPNCHGAGGWEEEWYPHRYGSNVAEPDEDGGRYWATCARCQGTGEINTFKEAVAKAVIKCGKALPDV